MIEGRELEPQECLWEKNTEALISISLPLPGVLKRPQVTYASYQTREAGAHTGTQVPRHRGQGTDYMLATPS